MVPRIKTSDLLLTSNNLVAAEITAAKITSAATDSGGLEDLPRARSKRTSKRTLRSQRTLGKPKRTLRKPEMKIPLAPLRARAIEVGTPLGPGN